MRSTTTFFKRDATKNKNRSQKKRALAALVIPILY
jgi:hypothetical protein